MTSIVKDRLSDRILTTTTYGLDLKNSGVEPPESTFSTPIYGLIDMAANLRSMGKITEDDLESFKSHLPVQGTLTRNHKDIDSINKTADQAFAIAELNLENKQKRSQFSKRI